MTNPISLSRILPSAVSKVPIVLAVTVACADNTPARIAAPRDTVVVNTTMLEPLDAHVVNRKGEVISRLTIRYSATGGDSVLLIHDDRAIQCRNNGVVPVTLPAGSLRSTVIVRCDIIEKIVAAPFACTRLGDPPLPLSVAAFDHLGNVIAAPRIYLLTDSSFVRIVNGSIFPLRPGDGDIGYTNGRRRATTLLRVLDTAAAPRPGAKSRTIHARDSMLAPVCARLPQSHS